MDIQTAPKRLQAYGPVILLPFREKLVMTVPVTHLNVTILDASIIVLPVPLIAVERHMIGHIAVFNVAVILALFSYILM